MNIKESVQLFEACLELDRKPVGVKFLWNKEDFMNFEVDQRDRKVTYCNSVQLASIGRQMKLTNDNQGCPNGAFALNFRPVPPPIASGVGRHSKNIYHDVKTAKSINDDMQFIQEEPFGIAVMPLAGFKEEPDVIIVVSGPYNIMRMLQGYGHFNGYTNNLRTIGLQAVCQDLTTYPYNTQDINISLLCPGTRLVADWKEGEIGMGLPYSKWNDIVSGVKETTNPFERNNKKKAIEKRLQEQGLDASWIKFDSNYDDGSYQGGLVEVEC